jgi:hypothetical protein
VRQTEGAGCGWWRRSQLSARIIPIGDIIPVPPLRAVFSIGDMLICLGIATMIIAAMRNRPVSAPATAAPEPAKEPT